MPAQTVDEILDFFKDRPIAIDEFEDLYVNADKGRGKPIYSILKRRLQKNPFANQKILFAGHKGCGKSTELVRLQRAIEQDFVVLNFSVRDELDIVNFNYIELFIVTMEKLFEFIHNENNIKIDKARLDSIRNWTSSGEIRKISKRHLGIDTEAGAGGQASIPFLLNFFAKFKTAAKASIEIQKIMITKEEPRFSQLIELCNLLIDDIIKKLADIEKKGLILIIEDLDKIDLKKGEEIFYDRASQLTRLHCNCIFTFPIALLYYIKFNPIKRNYDKDFVLPMIKVVGKTGAECADGIDVMKKIVKQRMSLSLFHNESILNRIISNSGGCLWDLFTLIKDASDSAVVENHDTITEKDYKYAYLSLKSDYEYTIAENKEKNIKVDDYYETLRDCALDKAKKTKSTEAMLDLRHNLCVLDYNGERWNDVHPIVKDILKEMGYIT